MYKNEPSPANRWAQWLQLSNAGFVVSRGLVVSSLQVPAPPPPVISTSWYSCPCADSCPYVCT